MLSCSDLSRRALTAAGTAVVATLLPFAIAAPAGAEDPTPAPTSTTSPSPEPTASSSPSPQPSATTATTSSSTTTTASTAPSPTAPAKQQSVVRISGPSSATVGRTVRIYARLLADGRYVTNGSVTVQRWSGSSWVGVGRITTGQYGLGSTLYTLTRSSRLRAYAPGTTTRTSALSTSIVITATPTLGQRAVTEAKRHYGKRYLWGATGPTRFDCSGFTGYVFRQLGRTLPRTSGQQQAAVRRVAVSSKQVGDLIFTWNGGRVTHVGIYAGSGQMWAATKSGDIVRPQSIYSRNITVGRVG